MTSTPAPLPFEALERVYERLAAAIDQAGGENESLFLAKLVMVMAHRAGDGLDFAACVATALDSLDVAAEPAPASAPSSP